VRNANVAGIVSGRGRETLDLLLSNTYCRSQQYLSRQLSQLHPQLTMPVFSGKLTYHFACSFELAFELVRWKLARDALEIENLIGLRS
jgi:hypothetical protein